MYPNLWLCIGDIEQYHDCFGKLSEWEHPVQFSVLLSGKTLDEYGGQIGEGYTMISGSGVQRAMSVVSPKGRYIGVSIEMPPDLLRTFFPAENADISSVLQFLTKGCWLC